MWQLFYLDGLFIIFSLSNFLGNLAVLLFVRSVRRFPRGALLGIYLGPFVCALVIWYLVDALVSVIVSNVDGPDLILSQTRRVRGRVRGWQRAIRFVGDYGPASLADQYGGR